MGRVAGGAVALIKPNTRVVADYIDAVWRRGDLSALSRFWTDDCVNHAGGGQVGLAALTEYHSSFMGAFAAFADLRIELVQQVAEEDRVVSHIVTTGRQAQAFAGIPASNKSASLTAIRIDRLRDGRIAEHWSVSDMAGLMAQLR